MELTVEDMPGGITRAVLAGRLDIAGASSVDLKFSVLAGSKKALVVDLAAVSFVASMGLRTLLLCARTMTAKGGRMALASPQPIVDQVLQTSGIGTLIGVYPTLDAAIAALAG